MGPEVLAPEHAVTQVSAPIGSFEGSPICKVGHRALYEIELILDALDCRPKGPRRRVSWSVGRAQDSHDEYIARGSWVDSDGRHRMILETANTHDSAVWMLWWSLSDELAIQYVLKRLDIALALTQCNEKRASLWSRIKSYATAYRSAGAE